MTARTLLLATAVMTSGMIGGLFFGWTVSVIPGTRLVDGKTYIGTMQQINRAIINPAFVISFLAPPAVVVAAAVLHLRAGMHRKATLLFIAAGTYVVGVLGVTMAGNVPLNDSLDLFDLAAATDDDVVAQRTRYEGPWNRWHNVRTTAAIVASGLCVAAAVITETGE